MRSIAQETKMAIDGGVISVVAVAMVAFLLGLARSAPESALVKSLPGYNGTLPSKHYSGYSAITIPLLFLQKI